jgi:hypothetical protein
MIHLQSQLQFVINLWGDRGCLEAVLLHLFEAVSQNGASEFAMVSGVPSAVGCWDEM